MAQYTIEDIEILRQKSGISYEEAVNLLEYHNGSLARALVDLEKNGRLKDSKAKPYEYSRRHHGVFRFLFRLRVKVTKGDIAILNLSALFLIFALLAAPWLVVLSAVAALLLGYRFAVERNSLDFAQETLESVVKNAGANVRNTVNTFAHDLGSVPRKDPDPTPAQPPEPEPRRENPASGTTPVNVQFSEDGSVHVTETRDGFHEADIQ